VANSRIGSQRVRTVIAQFLLQESFGNLILGLPYTTLDV
jgi:hypothetical protein